VAPTGLPMGNSLQKDYQIAENPSSSTSIFQIFPAANKKTKEHVSIFRCKIKDLESQYGVRRSKDILVRLRKAATLLTKVRHPNILRVLQPHLETRSEFYMVTEPVAGSISNIVLRQWGNSAPDSPNVTPSPTHARQKNLTDIEIRYGLMQIVDALAFLKGARICHLNLTPESIFITGRGDWKLDAFTFATSLTPSSHDDPNTPLDSFDLNDPLHFNKVLKSGDTISSSTFAPDLDFASPEYVTKNHYSFSSDIFSFACLYYLLRNHCYAQENATQDKNRALTPKHIDDRKLITANNSIHAYQNAINHLSNATASQNNNVITKPFLSHQQSLVLQKCLSQDTAPRPDPQDLLNDLSLFGEDVRALRFLANMAHKDFESKTFFMKQLPSMLNSFPDHVLVHKVLPPLTVESKRNADLAICALPNILVIAEKMSPKRFTSKIMPTLGRLFMATSPADIPLLCLRSMHVILEKTNDSQQQHTIFPFLLRSLKNDIPSVQIESLKAIEACTIDNRKLLNYVAFKRNMLPQILSIVKETTNPIIRQTAVETLMNTIHFVEKQVVIEEIIPTLEYCLSIDRSKEICVMIVRIYAIYSQKSHPKEIATKLLPVLIQLSVEPSIQYEDFENYMSTVRNMLQAVEDYRLSELERMENLRRIHQNQEASLEEVDIPKTMHPQQLLSTHEEYILDMDESSSKVHPNLDKHRSAPYVEDTSTLESFIQEQENTLNLNPLEQQQLEHQPAPLQPTRLSPEKNDTSNPPSRTPPKDTQDTQGEKEPVMAPPPDRRKRSESDSKRRDENFDNLLNRLMSDPGSPQTRMDSPNEEAIRSFGDSNGQQQNSSMMTQPAGDVSSVTNKSWVIADSSKPVDVSAGNPMDFFGMDDVSQENQQPSTAQSRNRSDSHDRTFDSLMSRVDMFDLHETSDSSAGARMELSGSNSEDDDMFENLLAKHASS